MTFRRVVILMITAAALIAGCSSGSGGSGTASPSEPVATSAAAHNSSPTPKPTPAKATHTATRAQLRAQAASGIAKIIKSQPAGGVSVAELNTATGARFSAGATSGMWTASSYKLLMLTAILLRNGSLSDGEVASATRAIENSDNVAGYALFLDAGGRSGVQSALDTLHMTHTVPGNSDPTFTTTSGSDYLKLLMALVTKNGPLSASSRSLVLNLMRNVEADQRWGVGVVADKGTQFANKNGWLSIDDSNGPGETDNGLWAVTSVGVVTVHHQQVLMAVFTRHQSSFGTGVALVQKLARTMVPAVSS